MAYANSYLWRLRQRVGNDLVLMPGAMVALRDADGKILLTKRGDDGTWCLPAGAAETGGHAPTRHALALLRAYLDTGSFQLR
jgi:8-oxo-dGTP pyrophosphatase MutT (NUDIX family)